MYWHKEKNILMHAEPNLDGIIADNPNESKPIGITREMLSESWFIKCQFPFSSYCRNSH